MINLDLLVTMDEPLELMVELEKLATALAGQRRPDADNRHGWETVAAYARLAKDELKAANEAPPR